MNKRIAPKKIRRPAAGPAKPKIVGKVRRTSEQVYGTRTEWMEIRKRVIERDGGRCRKCLGTNNLQVDHIRPAARGGQTVMANLWTLCADCHSKRPGHQHAKHLILAKKK